MDALLSIIIPAYNSKPYIDHLINRLKPQITSEIEVIVVDDGSKFPYMAPYDWVKVIRQENGGASSARNKGLDNANGKYIAFIDSDDLVSENYVAAVLEKIKTERPDYIYLSWKTLPGGWTCEVKLKSLADNFPSFNLCVWNRIYKKDIIGSTRFNEKKLIAEDAEFIRLVETEGKKKAYIDEYMYFYRSDTPGSLTKRFASGELNTRRVVYNLPRITKDMKSLVNEVKELDKEAEVIIMTNENELPELSRYAMILKPCTIKGTELRGESTPFFSKINLPIKTQVVIYTNKTFAIGGIETWIYNFCQRMHDYYDILVLYDNADAVQLRRLRKIVECKQNNKAQRIECDTVIINRITDKVPSNVSYKRTVQMVHAMRLDPHWTIPEGRDEYVCVSQAVKDSFGLDKAAVIHNMTYTESPLKALFLVSATRLSTFEKGTERMKRLAAALQEEAIPFVWVVFSDKKPENMPKDIVFLDPRLNVGDYIKKADYLVQLSDNEGFCYSIVEAWEVGTPVITTPIKVLKEIGFVEGVNGYTVDFDMKEVNATRFLEIPSMMPQPFDNKKQIEKWRNLLGKSTPSRTYHPPKEVYIKILAQYTDMELGRVVRPGEVISVAEDRANQIIGRGFATWINKTKL